MVENNNWMEAIFALIVGFLLVTSIPALKVYLDQLIGTVLTGIMLGIIAAIIIFIVWLLMERSHAGTL